MLFIALDHERKALGCFVVAARLLARTGLIAEVWRSTRGRPLTRPAATRSAKEKRRPGVGAASLG
jgi:hypothetical protein